MHCFPKVSQQYLKIALLHWKTNSESVMPQSELKERVER